MNFKEMFFLNIGILESLKEYLKLISSKNVSLEIVFPRNKVSDGPNELWIKKNVNYDINGSLHSHQLTKM